MSYEQWDEEFRQEPSYYPYSSYPYYKKRKKTGLLAILVMLALVTGVVSWIVNKVDLHISTQDDPTPISLEENQQELSMPAVEQTVPADKTSSMQKTEGVFEISQTPKGVENRPFEDTGALSLQQIYEKVYPSVASISCINASGSGTGTGIVLSHDGYVITNYHVIEDAQRIQVLLGDNSRYEATLVGGDEITDLAVLKVDAQNLQPAQFGDSDMLRVGDAVVAIGDPLGMELRGTMTDGIVSAINRDLNLSGRQMTLIQTNAALNSGNSGGPLINCYGQVIGINTMKMSSYSSTSSSVEGLGFAIPITQAKPVLDELIAQGYVSGRPAIGILGQTLDLRAQLFYHMPSGVIVTGLLEDSDAYQKGLEPDDVIVQFDSKNISTLDDLVAAKNGYAAGDVVSLTIYRNGRYYRVDVEMMDQIKPDIY